MCFGNSQTVQSTTGQNVNSSNLNTEAAKNIAVDPALSGASLNTIGDLQARRDAGYTPYQGERVSPMWGSEEQGQNLIGQQANKWAPEGTDQSFGWMQQAGNVPQQSVAGERIGTERAVDQGGKLGNISDYTSPYIKQVLDPQLQDLDEEGMRRKKELDSRAAMAGAFGDTGWGFGQAREADLTRRARQSAIGNANQSAWDRAMALREQDAGRFLDTSKFNSAQTLDVSKANAMFGEQYAQRLLQVGDTMGKMGILNSQNSLAINNALMNAGKAFRANNQAGLDAAYQEFSRQTGWPLEVSQMLISAINGSPANRNLSEQAAETRNLTSAGTTAGTTAQPNNSGFGLLGSLLGGIL